MPGGLEIRLPGKGRGQRFQIRERHLVIGLVRVAQIGVLHRSCRQCGLDFENRRGLLARGRRGIPQQRKHVRDVFHVGVAKLLRFLVRLQVILAFGQTQAALKRSANHLRAVLGVLR